jgi:hypothetical protein
MSKFTPSRRTLAKGAVWTAPAVVVASAAPAFAATSPLACPSTSCLVHTIGSAPSYSLTAHNGNVVTGKSRVQLNLGSIYINSACAPAGTTGFKFRVTSVTGYDQSGTPHTGTNLLQPADVPYVDSTGGALWVRADFLDFDYNASGIDPDWSSSHYLASYTITYNITYLHMLDGLEQPSTIPCPMVATVTAQPHATYLTGGLTRI